MTHTHETTDVGTVVAGRYRLLGRLASGGMATVHLSVTESDPVFRKLAVVKLMNPQHSADPAFRRMFLEEARLAALLEHPNIITTYDAGEDAGLHYIAMELLDGVTLHRVIDRFGYDGPINFATYLRILVEMLAALEYAHELTDLRGNPLRIVHRDVTPHNVMLTCSGQVKLLDFGIAKAMGSSVQTATGVVKGKVTYMAPEQALSAHDIDARADVYSVGILLWEICARRRRYAGRSGVPVLMELLQCKQVPPSGAAARGLPAAIENVLERALATRREDRYTSARDMRSDLEAILATLPEAMPLRAVGDLIARTFLEEQERVRRLRDRAPRSDCDSSSKATRVVREPLPSHVTAPTVRLEPTTRRATAPDGLPRTPIPRRRARVVACLVCAAAAAALVATFTGDGAAASDESGSPKTHASPPVAALQAEATAATTNDVAVDDHPGPSPAVTATARSPFAHHGHPKPDLDGRAATVRRAPAAITATRGAPSPPDSTTDGPRPPTPARTAAPEGARRTEPIDMEDPWGR